MIEFTTPQRANVKLKAAASGSPGSGKTRGLLALATGLTDNGRIGLISTEVDGTAFQIGRFKWEQYDLLPPYDPRRLEQAIKDVDSSSLDCLIVDSISLFWDGPGGMLDIKDDHDRRGANKERGYNANQFANWRVVTELGMALMDSIMRADLHVLLSLRAERKFREIDRKVIDVGWKPVFRAKHLFDPHCVWMLRGPEEANETGQRPHEINFYWKDRIGLAEQFPGERYLTAEFGKKIADYLGTTHAAPTSLKSDDIELVVAYIEPRANAMVLYGDNEAVTLPAQSGPFAIGDRIRIVEPHENGTLTRDSRSYPRYDGRIWEPVT